MTQTYEDFSKYGKEFADTGLKSFASLSKSAQALAVETTDYTKKSFENGSAFFEKLLSAKSFENAVEIQTDYVKQSYESFVAEATKFGELYADLARDGAMTLVFITHDIALASGLCQRVAVFHEGRLVEIGPMRDVLARPGDSYTATLIADHISLTGPRLIGERR